MNTDALIRKLSAQGATVPRHLLTRAVVRGLAGGALASALIFAALFGLRADLWAAGLHPVVAAKTLLPLALGVMALSLALTAARPGARSGAVSRVVWVVPALAVGLFLWALALPPDVGRQMALVGKSLSYCLPAIVGLSLPMTAALSVALRRGASVRPTVTGALAGLAAGGLSAALYSLYCTEDTPLFYALWYSVGIAIAAGLGAVVGARALRW
jgi:hypothetical protein